jgi:hypothetical protein
LALAAYQASIDTRIRRLIIFAAHTGTIDYVANARPLHPPTQCPGRAPAGLEEAARRGSAPIHPRRPEPTKADRLDWETFTSTQSSLHALFALVSGHFSVQSHLAVGETASTLPLRYYSAFKMVQFKHAIAAMTAACVGFVGAETSHEHALRLMEESPLIDTHIDLPQILRSLSENATVANALVRQEKTDSWDQAGTPLTPSP